MLTIWQEPLDHKNEKWTNIELALKRAQANATLNPKHNSHESHWSKGKALKNYTLDRLMVEGTDSVYLLAYLSPQRTVGSLRVGGWSASSLHSPQCPAQGVSR